MQGCKWIMCRVHSDPLQEERYKYVAPIALMFKYKKNIFGLEYSRLEYKIRVSQNGYRTFHSTYFKPSFFLDAYNKDYKYNDEEIIKAFKKGKVKLVAVVMANMRNKSRLSNTKDFYLEYDMYGRCEFVTEEDKYIPVKTHKKCKLI